MQSQIVMRRSTIGNPFVPCNSYFRPNFHAHLQTHFLLHRFGFQTWEYSPVFAIRSYAYAWLHALPALLLSWLSLNKMLVFYGVRTALAFVCSACETYFYNCVLQTFGALVARACFMFLLLGSGMFISSTAFLPSSFCMYCGLVAVGAWCQGRYALSVAAVGVSSLLGWPFSVALGVPIAFDLLFLQGKWIDFMTWIVKVSLAVLLPMVLIDYFYYRKLIIAPLGIVLYNVFGQGGPDLYGTEPWTFYFLNGFLNFNVAFFLAVACPVTWIFWRFILARLNFKVDYKAFYCLAPMLLWMAIFFTRPHKEERFLFPIYPLFCLAAALCIKYVTDVLSKVALVKRKLQSPFSHLSHIIPAGIFSIFTVLSLLRILALYNGYSAPLQVYGQLYSHLSKDANGGGNVCIGKEWYRFPSHFFLPSERWKVTFIRSSFKGQLPKHYGSGRNATWIIPTGMNDMNKEEPDRYIDINDCSYVIDFDDGTGNSEEPNYSQQTDKWKTIISAPFLIAARSNPFYRALFIPFLSAGNTVYGSYNVLESVRK